jgi:protein-disulfide isomerase
MKRKIARFTLTLGAAALAVLGQQAFAQTNGDLKKEIESIRASQKAMQKDIKIIRDILSGKQPPLENVVLTLDGAPVVGQKDAKVTLVEFSDYQCPFCGRYFSTTETQVMDEYVKTGKVKYYFRDFPLEQIHPNALKAAEAAHCAGDQNKFWEMHDRLFKNQQALDAKELPGHATVLGLDVPKFQQCLDTGKYTPVAKKSIEEGSKYNVRGTPGFFLGLSDPKDPSKLKAVTFINGAQPFTAFKDAIEKLLNPPKDEETKGSE